MKAVIYARYSSGSQREESIEGQIRECTKTLLEELEAAKEELENRIFLTNWRSRKSAKNLCVSGSTVSASWIWQRKSIVKC